MLLPHQRLTAARSATSDRRRDLRGAADARWRPSSVQLSPPPARGPQPSAPLLLGKRTTAEVKGGSGLAGAVCHPEHRSLGRGSSTPTSLAGDRNSSSGTRGQ